MDISELSSVLSPNLNELEKCYIQRQLDIAINEVEKGKTYTTEEVMNEYRKKYLNK